MAQDEAAKSISMAGDLPELVQHIIQRKGDVMEKQTQVAMMAICKAVMSRRLVPSERMETWWERLF